MALRVRVLVQAGTARASSVSSRMWKYSRTVLTGTCASLATAEKLSIVPWLSAATSRNRLKAGTLRVNASAAISSFR